MTTEEKAKAYDEALKRAKAAIDIAADKDLVKGVATTIFPELRESEDEKIWKELMALFIEVRNSEGNEGYWHDLKVADILAYLEEQKPKYTAYPDPDLASNDFEACMLCYLQLAANRQDEEMIMIDTKGYAAQLREIARKEQEQIQTTEEKEYIRTLKSLISDFIRDKQPEDVAYYQRVYDWLDGRHIEQKPFNVCEQCPYYKECPDYNEQKPNIELIQRSWYMEGYHDREFGKEPKWIIETGEGGPRHELNPRYGQPLAKEQKLVEGKEYSSPECGTTAGVWSEDFDKEVEKIHKRYPEVSFAKLTRIAYHFSKWANRCKDKEWSEEDEKLRQNLMSLLANMRGDRITEETYQKYYPWLKSLRPSWKPTYEQMEALRKAVNKLADTEVADSVRLSIMYDHLKKLM